MARPAAQGRAPAMDSRKEYETEGSTPDRDDGHAPRAATASRPGLVLRQNATEADCPPGAVSGRESGASCQGVFGLRGPIGGNNAAILRFWVKGLQRLWGAGATDSRVGCSSRRGRSRVPLLAGYEGRPHIRCGPVPLPPVTASQTRVGGRSSTAAIFDRGFENSVCVDFADCPFAMLTRMAAKRIAKSIKRISRTIFHTLHGRSPATRPL